MSLMARGIEGFFTRGGVTSSPDISLSRSDGAGVSYGQYPGQHLIHRDTERIDVRRKHRLPMELLGRHVRRAANHRCTVRCDLEKAGRAEVGHLQHVVVRYEHVGGPQIAMDHSLTVRVIDGVADLAREVQSAVQFQRALERDDVLEGFSLDVLHHDEEDVVLFLRRGDRDDVGMADAGKQTRLAKQLAEVQPLPVRDFDRDLLVDPGVVREVNGTETTAPKRRADLVLPECLASEEQGVELTIGCQLSAVSFLLSIAAREGCLALQMRSSPLQLR